ncbi:MAG: sterol desaturase family protein [Acidobacteria bacterium]|nr:sterol desaturase family protein [Acidobacteriota bacterium]
MDLMQHEPTIRLAVFFGVFAAVAIWEIAIPYRDLSTRKPVRWGRNLGLLVLDTVLVRLVLPAGAVGASLLAAERGWGVFNVFDAPAWVAVLASVVILDFSIWLQHLVFHAVPALWRLHMVHHADLDFDVTTGTRFHPIEILLSMLIKMAIVVILGAPALAVLVFEVLLNATAMFNHGNVSLPRWIDVPLRWMIVTPDMHRVHHSVKREECNSNFGFNLPWWDRLFGTYVPEPAAGREGLRIGVSHIRDERQTVPWLVGLPFLRRTGVYPFGRSKE